METNQVVEKIMNLKEKKQVRVRKRLVSVILQQKHGQVPEVIFFRTLRIIAHSYASHEIHPVADILSDSKSFFEEIMKLADDKENPGACLMVHAECKFEVAEVADYAVGTGGMAKLIAEMNHPTYILGTEIGFYHRMVRQYPEKRFVHLSDRLVCNAFKSIRLESVLECLQNRKEIIQIDNAIGRQLYEALPRIT